MKPIQTTHHLSRAGEANHPERLDTPAPDRSYAAPRLEHYGALRELTAGEIDLGGDYPEQDLS